MPHEDRDGGTVGRTRVARFRGLRAETRSFFEALEREPCPDTMPAGDRATYAAHVLSPLKALVTDLAVLLDDVTPGLGLEARVGASLFWPDGAHDNPEDCPVRQLRIWDAGAGPEESPFLFATFGAPGIDVGLSAESIAAPGPSCLAALTCAGWETSRESGLRVERRLTWEAWLDDPAFSRELADRFRELLPLFDELRRPVRRAAGGAAAPGAAPTTGAA